MTDNYKSVVARREIALNEIVLRVSFARSYKVHFPAEGRARRLDRPCQDRLDSLQVDVAEEGKRRAEGRENIFLAFFLSLSLVTLKGFLFFPF